MCASFWNLATPAPSRVGEFHVSIEADQLPMGLPLLGKPFGEATLLRVAHAYEKSTDWHKAKPVL